jgi:hypothetical protein
VDLQLTLMTLVSAGLWLVGCYAFISAAQEWALGRSEELKRRRRLSELSD